MPIQKTTNFSNNAVRRVDTYSKNKKNFSNNAVRRVDTYSKKNQKKSARV